MPAGAWSNVTGNGGHSPPLNKRIFTFARDLILDAVNLRERLKNLMTITSLSQGTTTDSTR